MATSLALELVIDALNMALGTRPPTRLFSHCDFGSLVYLERIGQRLAGCEQEPIDGLGGDEYENAMCESFFATLECELLDRCRFKTQTEARLYGLRTSRASTSHAAVRSSSGISRRSTESHGIMQQQSNPTHTSLPPCSRPSRTSPLGGPK